MKVKIKKLSENAVIPQKATQGSVAYDLYTPCDMLITKGRHVIPLEFAIELPIGYEAKIEPRSGFSSKGFEGCEQTKIGEEDYTPFIERFNADVIQGKVDFDYRDGVGVIIKSDDERNFFVLKGTRIAQMTIYKVNDVSFEEVYELSNTDRNGGFGSTGTK